MLYRKRFNSSSSFGCQHFGYSILSKHNIMFNIAICFLGPRIFGD